MAYSRPVWGIDVGQWALKALKLRWGAAGPEAVSLDIIEHPKILSQPDADEEQLVRDALEKLVSRNDMSGERVVISVPGQSAFARFIKLPPVEKKKVPEIVRYEARQQIPFAIEDVLWDYQPIGEEPSGLETEIGLFAIKKDLINDFVSNFVVAKIEVEAVQIAPLALYNFLVADEQIGEGATVLLDMGAENSNLLITDGKRIWLRNIPLGGNNFTRAISKARKLTFAAAEAEKRTIRQSKDARQIFEAVQPVFAELLAEVQRSMGYFTSLHRDVRIERILGMGNAFRMPGLRRYLAQNLQYRVDEFQEFKHLGDSEALKTEEAVEHRMALPTAYGLAVQGLEVAPLRTNLLPPEIVRTRIIQRKKPFAAAAVAVLALATGVSFLGALRAKSGAADEQLQREARRLISQRNQHKAEYDKALEKEQAQKAKTLPIRMTVKDRGMWLVILHELVNLMPDLPPDAVDTEGRWVRIEKFTIATDVIERPEEAYPDLEDKSIYGLPCRQFRLVGYTRVKEPIPFFRQYLFKPIEDSDIFSHVLVENIGPRTSRVPRVEGPLSSPTEIGDTEVREWFVEIHFLCVLSRVLRVAGGLPAIDPDYTPPAPVRRPGRQRQRPQRPR